MKRYYLLLLTIAMAAVVNAQQLQDEFSYRRSSLYSILVCHSEDKFHKEITDEFLKVPIPDKYNDFDLNVKVVNVSRKDKYTDAITDFVDRNNIGSRLVARWFNRNILTGECDMELVKLRGLYDASAFDYELASRTPRGLAMLQDAGEDLIANTFLLVNEITYIDKAEGAKTAATVLSILGGVVGAATGMDYVSDLGNTAASMVATIKGFRVKIHSRLYQLDWNDAIANEFYEFYYSDLPDEQKKMAFENNRGNFKMKYVGDVVSKGSLTSFLGINEDQPELMIRKACQRAIDENIVDLQKKYNQFKVKAPVISTSPTITAPIGMKEGVTSASRFEVLEVLEKDGRIEYKKVGVVKPVPGMIWDNRFMASEEGAVGADLGATTFIKVSGREFYPGMLIREIE